MESGASKKSQPGKEDAMESAGSDKSKVDEPLDPPKEKNSASNSPRKSQAQEEDGSAKAMETKVIGVIQLVTF